MPISLYFGKHCGSRIIIFRILDDRTEESVLRRLESQVEKYAEDIDISYEYADLRLSSRVPGTQQIVNSLRGILRDSNSNTIVFPVDRKVFLGKRRAIGETRWIEEFSEKQVVLVSGPSELAPGFLPHYPRILIPVLRKVHVGPFEMAEALTANAVFPDVDVVAAKVIEIPPTVPLYSVYKPESLIDADKQLSFLKSLRGGVFLGRIRPMVLLVRRASRDLIHFAKERKVDLIIMEGDWAARRHGFLPKEERGIASRADCTVLVTLPRKHLPRH